MWPDYSCCYLCPVYDHCPGSDNCEAKKAEMRLINLLELEDPELPSEDDDDD